MKMTHQKTVISHNHNYRVASKSIDRQHTIIERVLL